MSHNDARTKRILAILTLLIGIACATLLNAQTLPDSPGKAVSPDPAFVARANETILKARKAVDGFFGQASNVVSKENVSQMLIGTNNKPYYREDSVFEYQLMTSDRSGMLRLTENRESRKAAFRDPYKSLLITNGFASMLLVLHNRYEASYNFEPLLEEQSEGRTLLKVQFKAVPGAASPAAIQLSGRNYPLQLQGDLWIDEQSGAVVKLVSSLDGGMDDLGLHDIRSEVHYAHVEFHDPEEAYWLPTSAVIDVETPKQHWRNVHRFSEYRRFHVTIQVDLGSEKQ